MVTKTEVDEELRTARHVVAQRVHRSENFQKSDEVNTAGRLLRSGLEARFSIGLIFSAEECGRLYGPETSRYARSCLAPS